MKSMTGFGRGEYQGEGFSLQVEAKSLNHRFMEIVLRLPRRYQILEERIRREIQVRFNRGRFEIQARLIGTPSGTALLFVDRDLAARYLRILRELKAEFGLSGEVTVGDLLRLKEIFVLAEAPPEIETLWQEFEPALTQALEALSEMRSQEGIYLREAIYQHLKSLGGLLSSIEGLKEKHLKEAYRRLEERLAKLLRDQGLDPLRLHQEAAVLADRLDFTEELDRLKSHREHFVKIMEGLGPHGRKLDFLCQEMFREINTLANKAASAEISHLAVEVKAVIEKIREQVQNIE